MRQVLLLIAWGYSFSETFYASRRTHSTYDFRENTHISVFVEKLVTILPTDYQTTRNYEQGYTEQPNVQFYRKAS